MNPPFSDGQDIAHVMAAWPLLKPGGRLVAITSPGWKFRQTKPYTTFKSWLEEVGALTEDLPAGTFAESGTEISTTMIVVKKEA